MPRSYPLVVALVVASALLSACSGTQTPGAASSSPLAIAQSSRSALTPSSSPPPTATPAATTSLVPTTEAVAGCPTGPVTLETLIGLRDDPGPLSRRYGDTLDRLNERALECFGSATLSLVAFVAGPQGLGGTVAFSLAPAWLDTAHGEALYLAASDREAAPGAPSGPFLAVAVPPELHSTFDALRGTWVTVGGQFDAPAARSCVATPVQGVDVPSPAEIVEICRTSFTVNSVKPASDPCPETDSLQAFITTPEYLRADCFGGRTITFDAVGWPINNTWPGLEQPPELLGDWVLSVDGQADGLWVFVPGSVSSLGIYDIYPHVARWEVSGHFDDQSAEACIPAQGDTVDGVQSAMSIGDARAFCRNHFAVDRLARLPDATPSPVVKP